jgi:deoxyribodipyrimidine photo-lyase
MQINERVTLLNRAETNKNGRYILYWMQIFKRADHNHALNYAVELANERGLPLVVYEGLKYYYPWANDRLHTFILEGVNEKREALARRGIRYLFYLQRNERDPRDTVARLAREAAALVTDDFPCFIVPEHNRNTAARVKIPVFAVDANGLVPLSKFAKEEFAARTIRPKIHRMLPECVNFTPDPKLKFSNPALEIDCPEETVFTDNEIPALVASCAIDHSVPPSPLYHGGTANGRKRLRHFAENLLAGYDETRNEPSVDGSSRLSPYLHFGFLAPQEVYEAVQAADAPPEAKAAYLEEFIVRRELSYNMTRFNPHYDSLEALPAWALKTMREHADDARQVYSVEQIETAATHDEMWNATQRELLHTGLLHNYVRMLWGKKIMEWRPAYAESFDLMVHLNNKYALDGRNPNSYTGILWCFGKHDRAWGPQRPVFGTLRYMSSPSMARKINAQKYIAWTNELAPPQNAPG